jgi:hypothetical protein
MPLATDQKAGVRVPPSAPMLGFDQQLTRPNLARDNVDDLLTESARSAVLPSVLTFPQRKRILRTARKGPGFTGGCPRPVRLARRDSRRQLFRGPRLRADPRPRCRRGSAEGEDHAQACDRDQHRGDRADRLGRAAGATPPSAVSGTETITGATATVVRTADGNTTLAVTLTGIVAGSFTGTFTAARGRG